MYVHVHVHTCKYILSILVFFSYLYEQEVDKELSELNRVIKNSQKGIVNIYIHLHVQRLLSYCLCHCEITLPCTHVHRGVS